MITFRTQARAAEQRGFTLTELLVVMLLTSILMTLGGFAIRNYWFVRSLEGGADEVVTQLRRLQQRVGAASNPLVYGARFTEGSSDWQLIEYNIESGECTLIRDASFDRNQEFDASVRVEGANFSNYGTGGEITEECKDGADAVVFFFARGSATRGQLTIEQPKLEGREEKICVAAITGRVTRVEGPCP